MSHSPAPWTLKYEEINEYRTEKQILTAEGVDIMGNVEDPWYPNVPENKADWLLIAAAPDLYAACKTFQRIWNGDISFDQQSMCDAENALVAAIAKAEGPR